MVSIDTGPPIGLHRRFPPVGVFLGLNPELIYDLLQNSPGKYLS